MELLLTICVTPGHIRFRKSNASVYGNVLSAMFNNASEVFRRQFIGPFERAGVLAAFDGRYFRRVNRIDFAFVLQPKLFTLLFLGASLRLGAAKFSTCRPIRTYCTLVLRLVCQLGRAYFIFLFVGSSRRGESVDSMATLLEYHMSGRAQIVYMYDAGSSQRQGDSLQPNRRQGRNIHKSELHRSLVKAFLSHLEIVATLIGLPSSGYLG